MSKHLWLTLACLLAMLALSAGAAQALPTSAAVKYDAANPTLAFAAAELTHFLEQSSDLKFGADDAGAGWRFTLAVDPQLPPFAFQVSVGPLPTKSEGAQVTLSGHDARGVLDAVYTLLERAGFVFEVNGPLAPRRANLAALKGYHETIRPAVARRGIRQHINFPMDVSSYTQAGAVEYMRNLARMRMNHITFHSYPDQWYSVQYPDGRTMKAGAFFYGVRFDMPDHALIRKTVKNQKTFCIPEIEPYYDQPEEKSRRAQDWLRTLMVEAKRMGMHVQFSFELREQKMEDSLATCESIAKIYPQIDTLEIITQENGGGGPKKVNQAEILKVIEKYYGPEAAKDPALEKLTVDETDSLTQMISELGHNTQVVKEMQKRWAGQAKPALAIGIYATPRQYLGLAVTLMRKYLPADVTYDFLPSHGAREAYENVNQMPLEPSDWQRMLVSSWAEFDGNMYLQENEIEGIRQMIDLGTRASGGQPMYGLALNHWRSAENRTTLRYAAQAFVRGPIPSNVFYAEYAKALGVGKVEQYAKAMLELDDLQTWLWQNIPAVGFCLNSMWVDNPVAMMSWWTPENEAKAIARFQASLDALKQCKKATPTRRGRQYLTVLEARVQGSILHLEAIRKLQELRPLWDLKDPKKLTDAQRQQVLKVCSEAAPLAERYMKLLAGTCADRGCEGVLINYYYCLPTTIKKMRVEWGGEKAEAVKARVGSDVPPVPVSNK